jgi:hypothetical protein
MQFAEETLNIGGDVRAVGVGVVALVEVDNQDIDKQFDLVRIIEDFQLEKKTQKLINLFFC